MLTRYISVDERPTQKTMIKDAAENKVLKGPPTAYTGTSNQPSSSLLPL